MDPKTPRILKYIIPSFQDFVYITIMFLGVFLGPRFLGDGDPGRHIVIGQLMLAEGYIPKYDVFSHTRNGLVLTTTEWLSEVLFAAAHLAMGLNGVVLLAICLIAVTCTLVFRETAKKSGSYLVAFILVYWMVAATLFHWLARPHLFSWLMTAIWAIAVRRLAQGQRAPLWQFPLMMLLWANLHGGFVIGFLILIAYLGGWAFDFFFEKNHPPSSDILRRLSIVGITSLLVTVLNPAGVNLWNAVFGHVGDAELMSLQIDWRSPDFHLPNSLPFLLLVAASFFVFAIKSKKLESGQALLCGGLAVLAFYSVRNIPYFVIVCLPVIGEALKETGILRLMNGTITALQNNLTGFMWSGMATVIVAILLISGQALDLTNLGNTFDPNRFPVDAVNWLEEHPQRGNPFNEFTWGGYMLYRLWPRVNVFIDGQTDFYGAGLVKEYLIVLDGQDGWETILDKYEVEWVLVPRNSPLVNRLKLEPKWVALYEDNIAIVMRKRMD